MLSEITISAEGGSGGNGAISFRRERYVPRGGPDGGDGGDGGSVIVRAEESWRGFEELRGKRRIQAKRGGNGAGRKKHGSAGTDVVIDVPVGTTVWKEGDGIWVELADLWSAGAQVIVATGGEGGKGNARFTTSTNQAPRIAEKGLVGGRARIKLELRLLADVGLVGLPNAGKSSLLGAMTSARPDIADYAFTTLEAQLGVVTVGYDRFVLADIPGLIEGASDGRGLGTDFLQQIERTSVLVLVVDGSRPDPGADLAALQQEIIAYGRGVAEKQCVIALNKTDLLAGNQVEQITAQLRSTGLQVHGMSAKTGEGTEKLAQALLTAITKERARRDSVDRLAVVRPQPAAVYQVEKIGESFTIHGVRAEEAAAKLGAASVEAQRELWRRLGKMGATAALRRAGAKPGGRVRVGTIDLELPE